jgi:hypothetical protein
MKTAYLTVKTPKKMLNLAKAFLSSSQQNYLGSRAKLGLHRSFQDLES